MENLNNPIEEKNDVLIVEETPATPVVEEVPVAETPVVAATPVVETTPNTESAAEPTAIKTSDFGRSVSEKQQVGTVANGAIGVAPAAPVAPKKPTTNKTEKKETVAIHSTKNVTWDGVGKVYTGYNIVEKKAADKWLTRSHVRLATPEEVAKEFGK
jgi:hypothetical protein